jgi:hypothetical protein
MKILFATIRHLTDTKVYAKALVPFLVTWCFGGIF